MNVSRRDFLKCAGVMALAAAATGVLAGCSGESDTKNIKINYTVSDDSLSSYDTTTIVSVISTAEVLSADFVKKHVPEGFALDGTASSYEIISDETGYHADAKIAVADDYVKVTINYKDKDGVPIGSAQAIVVKKTDTVVKAASLKLPDNYKTSGNNTEWEISNKTVTVTVEKKS